MKSNFFIKSRGLFLLIGVLSALLHSEPGICKKQSASKALSQGHISKFKGEFYYTVTMSDEHPPVATDCKKLDDAGIKAMKFFKCDKSDETTQLFGDWNCSEKVGSNVWATITLDGKNKCEKALQDFRARN